MDSSSLSRRALLAAPFLVSAARASAQKLKVAIFSKHLQFLAGDELAQTVADMGYDGLDITVRKGGHVEPERVEQDLPPLVAILRKHNVAVPMITVDIVDTTTPHAEPILKTMASLEIPNYRWGGFKYEGSKPFAAQLEAMKPRIAKLAALNARYNVCAMYHTHSGVGVVGAPIWDLHILLRDFDPKAVGVNYDVGHATIEGGIGGWIDSFRVTGAHVRGIAVKDFAWGRDGKGTWQAQWKPLGEGMVRFPQFFGMVAESGFSGPLQLHFEYPLGGAENGKAKPTMPREEILSEMKRDLVKLRGYLTQAGLS